MKALWLATLLAPLAVAAHPGHETAITSEGWVHLVTQHALPGVAIAIALAIVWRLGAGKGRHGRRRRAHRDKTY